MKNTLKYKKRNNKFCCDVDNCNNYAYAEMYKKDGWMYVCSKHYKQKLKDNISFCILDKN